VRPSGRLTGSAPAPARARASTPSAWPARASPGGSTREAKKICTGCEVKAQCLEYALANDERFGIWGGLSERERRRLRRRAV
jgi:hypothetical protein